MTKSKRLKITIAVFVSWFIFGIIAFVFNTSFVDLAAYFGSLSAFIGTYIWGETKRPHDCS